MNEFLCQYLKHLSPLFAFVALNRAHSIRLRGWIRVNSRTPHPVSHCCATAFVEGNGKLPKKHAEKSLTKMSTTEFPTENRGGGNFTAVWLYQRHQQQQKQEQRQQQHPLKPALFLAWMRKCEAAGLNLRHTTSGAVKNGNAQVARRLTQIRRT